MNISCDILLATTFYDSHYIQQSTHSHGERWSYSLSLKRIEALPKSWVCGPKFWTFCWNKNGVSLLLWEVTSAKNICVSKKSTEQVHHHYITLDAAALRYNGTPVPYIMPFNILAVYSAVYTLSFYLKNKYAAFVLYIISISRPYSFYFHFRAILSLLCVYTQRVRTQQREREYSLSLYIIYTLFVCVYAEREGVTKR